MAAKWEAEQYHLLISPMAYSNLGLKHLAQDTPKQHPLAPGTSGSSKDSWPL